MNQLHVVTGAGPVGTTVALQLADQGHRVRILTRSGSGPEHPLVERRKADVSKVDSLAEAFADAVAVHHCIHGSRYAAATWRAELLPAEQAILEAAGRAGAVVVFPESLYAYGVVDGTITEDLPRNATIGKPGVRTELLRGRAASTTPTVSVAASDFFGPLVRTAHAGDRMVPTILAGRTMRVVGSLDQPHSFTYVPDLAAAMIRAAADPALWGSVLHAPTAAPVTQRQLIEAFAHAAGVPVPKVGTIPAGLLRLIGLVHGDTRELAEMSFQLTAPFDLDSSRSEERLGLKPTAFDTAVQATVDWWRTQEL
ncbi:NAD-dependent epimerase/dehydratase family protein [Nocardioides immobilis]|uniref:NAD-dependent epimerase/dehydratase family protein n=1 Tax=Nocardioides immobilis TaxID=2049295 RepID=A0A417Y7U7_9ACTN|nr:NAD-dependent epimerase/dehydratase family protein [Nocardioides immobilis]RHW28759.1 NAD-dependent epimerase/dehydratase family protein [Nocardioides immobilis]